LQKRQDRQDFASLMGDATRFEPVPRPAAKKPPSPPPRPRNVEAQPHFVFPDPLEPRFARARNCPERELNRLLRGDPPPVERLDLHGFDQKRAQRQLARFLESAAARDAGCVLVIHGHGGGSGDAGGVLKEMLPGWLTSGSCGPNVRAFAPAQRRDGGEGAIYLLIEAHRTRNGTRRRG